MMGSTSWEEAVIDMIVETCLDIAQEIPSKIYIWKVFKFAPEPENSVEAIAGIRERMVAGLNFIQGVAEKRGNKFIVTNEVWAYVDHTKDVTSLITLTPCSHASLAHINFCAWSAKAMLKYMKWENSGWYGENLYLDHLLWPQKLFIKYHATAMIPQFTFTMDYFMLFFRMKISFVSIKFCLF